MTKQLLVSSAVQVALLKEVIIPQMSDGFWKNHRPVDHAAAWKDVEIVISASDSLGPIGWKIPRTYNFVNPEFIKPNEELLVATAQAAKASSNFRSVKKELIELSRIVGGRLVDKNSEPTKAHRGVNRHRARNDTPVLTVARDTLATTGRRTAVKRVDVVTSGDTTVRRVPIVKAD